MPRGSIEVLRTGFRARVYSGKDPFTGKQTYLRGETRRHRRDAEADAERLLAQVEADRLPDHHATVGVLLDRWMEVVDHELSTAEANVGYVRRTLRPALGDMPLRKLQHRVDILDRLYTHLRRCNVLCDGRKPVDRATSTGHRASHAGDRHVCRPMAPAAVRRAHAILSCALNYAVSWGWIERNPADYAHPPKVVRRQAHPPQPERVADLLNAAGNVDEEFAVFLWLAVTTGARRGELAALRWSNIDLDRGLLRVDTNYVVRDGQRRLKSTKTGGERWLSLDALTVQLLSKFGDARRSALAPAGLQLAREAFIFSPDPAGRQPWHPDHFTHAYRALADSLGIPEPLKNLRHFNATQLLAAGVDLRTTAGRLGHSDGGATTLRVYASRTRRVDQKAAELLAADLDALRKHAAAGDGGVPVGSVRPRPLARVARPFQEVLPQPVVIRTYCDFVVLLREAIAAGRLAPGDLLPTVGALAEHCRLARSTAHRAIGVLAADGTIVRIGPRWTVGHGVDHVRVTSPSAEV